MEKELNHEVIYDQVGRETFVQLVNTFYSLVETDDLLRPMYPKSLEMAKHKLTLFLLKKFGGPDEYTPLRGHPRMRRRHMKFEIGLKERNRWMKLMKIALEQVAIEDEAVQSTLTSYFEWMATHMINQTEFNIH